MFLFRLWLHSPGSRSSLKLTARVQWWYKSCTSYTQCQLEYTKTLFTGNANGQVCEFASLSACTRLLVHLRDTLANPDEANDDDESERKQLGRSEEVLHSGGCLHTVAVHERQQDCRGETEGQTGRERKTDQLWHSKGKSMPRYTLWRRTFGAPHFQGKVTSYRGSMHSEARSFVIPPRRTLSFLLLIYAPGWNLSKYHTGDTTSSRSILGP